MGQTKWNCIELKKPPRSGEYLCTCCKCGRDDWLEILEWDGRRWRTENAKRPDAFVAAWMKLPDVYRGVLIDGFYMAEYENGQEYINKPPKKEN